jgi:hypothetical protein
MRSIAAGQNVPEKNPAKGVARMGFFEGQAAYRRRSGYSPVRRSGAFIPFLFPIPPSSFCFFMQISKYFLPRRVALFPINVKYHNIYHIGIMQVACLWDN